jgi:hypothetical protein
MREEQRRRDRDTTVTHCEETRTEAPRGAGERWRLLARLLSSAYRYSAVLH